MGEASSAHMFLLPPFVCSDSREGTQGTALEKIDAWGVGACLHYLWLGTCDCLFLAVAMSDAALGLWMFMCIEIALSAWFGTLSLLFVVRLPQQTDLV